MKALDNVGPKDNVIIMSDTELCVLENILTEHCRNNKSVNGRVMLGAVRNILNQIYHKSEGDRP